MAILSRVTGFWDSFSFVKNVKKMRKALVEYLTDEGIKCEIKDGCVICEYQGEIYTINFAAGEDYAECGIVYECEADEYVSLDITDKTFIADKVNTDLYNHATVYAYNDSFKIDSTFYFTSKNMWNELFIKHFNELNEAVAMAMDIICEKIADDDKDDTEKPRRIGFCVPEQNENTNGNDVAAIVK